MAEADRSIEDVVVVKESPFDRSHLLEVNQSHLVATAESLTIHGRSAEKDSQMSQVADIQVVTLLSL